jgi:hypothetical protein
LAGGVPAGWREHCVQEYAQTEGSRSAIFCTIEWFTLLFNSRSVNPTDPEFELREAEAWRRGGKAGHAG